MQRGGAEEGLGKHQCHVDEAVWLHVRKEGTEKVREMKRRI